MKIVVAITGASGIELGLKCFSLIEEKYEKYLIVSKNAKIVSRKEKGNNVFFDDEIWQPPASGSFKADIVMIIPCSMNTLGKIAAGISDNLITRAAAVAIKEKKTLLLAPREMPFSPIDLQNMAKLSALGVIIAPPVMGYYSDIKSLEEMEKFVIGKWFDAVGIENELFRRWEDVLV